MAEAPPLAPGAVHPGHRPHDETPNADELMKASYDAYAELHAAEIVLSAAREKVKRTGEAYEMARRVPR